MGGENERTNKISGVSDKCQGETKYRGEEQKVPVSVVVPGGGLTEK